MKRNKSNMISMMPKMAIVLVAIVFIFSLFKIGTTKASSDVVEVTNVEISAKSDTTDVDTVKFEDGKIKNNVTFHKVGDYLTYNVTITNKEDKNYTLKTITDNNGNESLTYSYSGYEGAKLEANKAATFKVTITYAKELEDINKRNQSNLVALTLTFEDEEGNEQEQEVIVNPDDDKKEEETPAEDNNDNETTPEESTEPAKEESKEEPKAVTPSKDQTPQTGDNIGVYITTAVASFVLLVVLSRRQMVMNKKAKKSSKAKHGKHGMKMLGLILAIALLVPTFSNISKAATTSTLSTSLDTTIKFMDKLVVSYDVGDETKEQVIPYNGTIADLEEPAKEGFNFTGWTTADGTPLTEETKITEDTEIVAQFEELAKTSEITITVEDERTRDFSKNVTLSAVNTNISDDKVKLQYSLDDGATWTDYSDTIVLEENLTLKVRTVVKDSNAVIGEAEKEIDTIMTTAKFKPGKTVASTMFTLAGAEEITWVEDTPDMFQEMTQLFGTQFSVEVPNSDGNVYADSAITSISKATEAQYNAIKDNLTNSNIVSVDDSEYPIYMWFDNGTIYYYSEAEALLTNEDASYMFSYMLRVTNIDLSSIYTNKTENLMAMFFDDEDLTTLDVSNFRTSNVTNMRFLFWGISAQVLDVSKFDTSKVTDMAGMFIDPYVEELDLSNFDTSNVTNMVMMFYSCDSLTELDLSSFDTSNVRYMGGMFMEAIYLTTIYASDKFDVSNVENSTYMFYAPVVGGNGTTFSEEHMDKEYARIDTDETPGYFSGTPWKCTIKIDGTVVKDSTKLAKGDQKVLTVSDCDEAVTYASSDSNVLTIDSNGNITAVNYGTAKITVTGTETGSKKSITVTVAIRYSTTLGGEQYESYWQIFHKEDGYVYLILDDYLPNNKVNIEGIQKYGSYNVYVNTNRADLINAMTNEEYWNSLLAGTIGNNTFNYKESTDDKIMAMGSPTLDLFVESWNANHPDQQLYTAKKNDMTDSIGWGYYIGQSENPTSYSTEVSNSDLLYFPHPSMTSLWNGCGGYWLASTSADSTYSVMSVRCGGRVRNGYYYNNAGFCFRPVVCLPSSVLE